MAQPGWLGLDIVTRVVNVHWGGGRFAVCGFDGNLVEFAPAVFFGVGAYSKDGKTWTKFREFENGAMESIFPMLGLLVVGGSINGDEASTASLKTILGSGPNVEGGTSGGLNVANFGSIGYDKKTNKLYAVENSGERAETHILHTFGGDPDDSSISEEIVWVGPHHPDIEPVQDCSCTQDITMTFNDKDGKKRTLSIDPERRLLLDAVDINPPDAELVMSAAGGLNDGGEVIIIAVGYQGEDFLVCAWWSINGQEWTEISGIWSGDPDLHTAKMASAVPN